MQIGNAVPPPLAKAIALCVLKMLTADEAESNTLVKGECARGALADGSESSEINLDDMRKSYVTQINAEQRKAELTATRSDANYLTIGRLVCEFIQKGTAAGEKSEDALFRSIVKDPACKVKKSALYNARGYYRDHSAMVDTYGAAPTVPMTFFVKVRSKYLSVKDRYDLLSKAAADRATTVATLGTLVRKTLREKGYVKEEDTLPQDIFLAHCKQAFRAVTTLAADLKKGLRPSEDAFHLLLKTSAMFAMTVENAKRVIDEMALPDEADTVSIGGGEGDGAGYGESAHPAIGLSETTRGG